MAAQSSHQCITFPMDMLLDELQEKVLFLLPIDDAVRCQVVQKKWRMGIKSWTLCTPMDFTPIPQKPYYVIFNTEVDYLGTYAYNSAKERWVPFDIPNSDDPETLTMPFELPLLSQNSFYISTSRGLVCFLNSKFQDDILVCNPILKNKIRLLPKVPDATADYCAVALSTDVDSRRYAIAVVRSSQQDVNWFKHNVTIQLYRSETCSWVTLHSENAYNWRGGDTCVICKDVLYSVAQFNYMLGQTAPYHAIITFNLSQGKQKQSLAKTMVPAPCILTCVRLLNLNDKLIMVGGIQKQGTAELETVGIWELYENKWKEITRAPDDIIRIFGKKIDPTFITSGSGNLIFIQAYTSRAVLTYEFYKKVWTFVPKSPLPLVNDDSNYFSGFCFEPRLDIVP